MLLHTLLKRLQIGCAVLLTIGVFASVSSAENWPQWRGSTGNGISKEKNLPAKWSRTKNVAWRLELPGVWQSTPTIWDERIFLTVVGNKDEELAASQALSHGTIYYHTFDALWAIRK